MTVVNPKSISGITSITTASGSDNLLTIHTSDANNTERLRIDSTGTTKIVTGIVTTLTATGSAKVGSGVTLSPDGDVFTTGITTSSSVIVGGGVTISESGIEASGIGITCANINGTQIGGRRNLIINGAMEVAQRGTAATTDQLYQTVDRMRLARAGCDENPTQNQQTINLGGQGFTKSFRIVNGNQTSGAGSGDSVGFSYRIEARDMRMSGWDYTNPNSFITLQFWVYSNVGQTYYMRLRTVDGTAQQYVMSYTLSANTWTKIVKTIPGNSNIQFDDDVNQGLQIAWNMFTGTNNTDSGVSLNSWSAFDTNAQFPDFDSTWYTTDNATFNITGLQLEVGPQATAFEHRSFAEELQLCKRYYQQYVNPTINGIVSSTASQSNNHAFVLPVEMRAAPTLTLTKTGTNGQRITDGSTTVYANSLLSSGKSATHLSISYNLSGDLTNHRPSLAIGPVNTDDQSTYKIEAEI